MHIQLGYKSGGIVGRGVLLDYAAWAEAKGIAVNHFTTSAITVSDLKEVAASQNVTFRQGDILLIRTGWIKEYQKLSDEKCKAYAELFYAGIHWRGIVRDYAAMDMGRGVRGDSW